MSDQSKDLAELKQQIVDEVSANQNAGAELTEEELEAIAGGTDQARFANHNMGVRTIGIGPEISPKFVNANMGVRTVSVAPEGFPKILNHNMGVRNVRRGE